MLPPGVFNGLLRSRIELDTFYYQLGAQWASAVVHLDVAAPTSAVATPYAAALKARIASRRKLLSVGPRGSRLEGLRPEDETAWIEALTVVAVRHLLVDISIDGRGVVARGRPCARSALLCTRETPPVLYFQLPEEATALVVPPWAADEVGGAPPSGVQRRHAGERSTPGE
jgi:hypothetical protein